MTSTIGLSTGIELAATIVDRVARDQGIRLLVIKGPVAEAYGLRPERQSNDLDVLVDPAAYDAFLDALERAGWRRNHAVEAREADAVRRHSAAVRSDSAVWPLEIDVHSRFPGFLADDDIVFEALWQGRASLALAGREVPVPGREGAVLIEILNAARSQYASQTGHLAELAGGGGLDRRSLTNLAERTQAAVVPFFELVGWPPPAFDADPDRLAEWELETRIGAVRSVAWVATLRRASPWAWPRLLWHAFWPSDELIRERTHDFDADALGLLRLRWRRLVDGLRDAPRALHLVFASRRDRGASRVKP